MISRQKALALRRLIEKAAISLPDEDALEAVELYPVWAADTAYDAGIRVRYVDKLYRCEQGHTSQDGWNRLTFLRCGQTLQNPVRYPCGDSRQGRRTPTTRAILYITRMLTAPYIALRWTAMCGRLIRSAAFPCGRR